MHGKLRLLWKARETDGLFVPMLELSVSDKRKLESQSLAKSDETGMIKPGIGSPGRFPQNISFEQKVAHRGILSRAGMTT
jgi:hypothetical protein